jgi:acyl carrier protein
VSDQPLHQDELRGAVLNHLADHTSSPEIRDAQGDVLLSECGLDSFGSFEFIMSLEERFDVTIDDRHLDARRLRSVNGIVELLRALR